MSYVSHLQLAESPGARELSQVASSEYADLVDYSLMDASLRGSDRSNWSSEEITAADDALARIDAAIANADAMIDGFLAPRGYLPLTEKFVDVPAIVTVWSRAIARYLLHKDRVTDANSDPIVRDYKDAMTLLQQTASGKFSLGAGDTTATGGVGSPDWAAPARQFTRDTLRDF